LNWVWSSSVFSAWRRIFFASAKSHLNTTHLHSSFHNTTTMETKYFLDHVTLISNLKTRQQFHLHGKSLPHKIFFNLKYLKASVQYLCSWIWETLISAVKKRISMAAKITELHTLVAPYSILHALSSPFTESLKIVSSGSSILRHDRYWYAFQLYPIKNNWKTILRNWKNFRVIHTSPQIIKIK